MAGSMMMLALTLRLLLGTSAVRDSGTSMKVAGGCPCFDHGTCSSCDMSECPFVGDITYVKAFGTGGSDSLNGYAAWTVKCVEGVKEKYFVVKFGGVQKHKEEGILAAQVAHDLHVMTPKQILIDSTSCPTLWGDSFSDTSFHDQERDAFIKSLSDRRTCMDQECGGMPNVVVQEHAGFLKDFSEITNIEQSFWYQAGAISAFDWIMGKSDLFNDLSLEWRDSRQEETDAIETNRHNIYFNKKRLVAIDLGINMGGVEWPFWDQLLEQVPRSSSAQDLPWVNQVLFPMLAMMRADGGHGRVVDFGDFNRDDLSGWDRRLSPLLTMLGLSKTIQRALEMSSAPEPGPKLHEFLASLTGMQKAKAKDDTFWALLSGNVQQLDLLVTREVKKRKEEGWRCCQVNCDRRWLYGVGREACKVQSEYVWMKLGSTSVFIDGFLKTVQEQDCDDITSYRLSIHSQDKKTNQLAADLRNQHCACAQKDKKQRIALTDAASNDYCDSA